MINKGQSGNEILEIFLQGTPKLSSNHIVVRCQQQVIGIGAEVQRLPQRQISARNSSHLLSTPQAL